MTKAYLPPLKRTFSLRVSTFSTFSAIFHYKKFTKNSQLKCDFRVDFENFGGFGRVSRVGLSVGLCNPCRGGYYPPALLAAYRLKREAGCLPYKRSLFSLPHRRVRTNLNGTSRRRPLQTSPFPVGATIGRPSYYTVSPCRGRACSSRVVWFVPIDAGRRGAVPYEC